MKNSKSTGFSKKPNQIYGGTHSKENCKHDETKRVYYKNKINPFKGRYSYEFAYVECKNCGVRI